MRRVRGVVGMVAVAVFGLGVAGCGGDGGDGKAAGTPPSASVAGSVSQPTASSSTYGGPSVAEALAAYRSASTGGCETADDCHFLMVRRLAASEVLRGAMQGTDRAAYSEPLRLQSAAEQQADHFGRDSLGAKGAYAAVDQPLRQLNEWFAQHPGM